MNASGQRLQVYPPTAQSGAFDTARLANLELSNADNPPAATTQAATHLNLAANAQVPATASFDPADAASYNHTTSVTVSDSLGAAHTASLFFVKAPEPNAWNMHVHVDGQPAGAAIPLSYSANGTLITPANGEVSLPPLTMNTGAAPVERVRRAGSVHTV